MNEEAQKALAQLQSDLKGVITDEVKTAVAGAVSKEVLAKMEEMNKENKQPTKADMDVDSLKYFKAKYKKDIFGENSEDLKLGKKDLDTTTTGSGEELVPEGFGNEVIRIAAKVGVARGNSRVINLPTKIYTLPTLGNATAYRVDEKGAITSSTIGTGGVVFTAQKLAGMVIATKECIEDANVDVMSWISTILGESIARKEDEWAFLGLGAGEGIFQNVSVPAYTIAGTSYDDVTLDEMLLALNEVDDNVVGNLRWLNSFSILNHLRSLKNQTTGQYYLQSPAATMPSTIWDLPYSLSTVMPKTTDQGSQADKPFMAAYDPRYLMIGDHRSLSLEFSKDATVTSSDGHTSVNLFEKDMVAIKVTERIDIQLAQPDKAFVRLETAAS